MESLAVTAADRRRTTAAFIVVLVLAVIAGVGGARAEGLIGAEKFIAAVQESGAATGPKAAALENAVKTLWQDMELFKKVRGDLPSGEAADRWLALFDRFWKLPPNTRVVGSRRWRPSGAGQGPIDVVELFNALPPPMVWAALQERVAARPLAGSDSRREALLRILVLYMNGKYGDLENAVSDYGATIGQTGDRRRHSEDMMRQFRALQLGLDEGAKDKIVGRFSDYLRALASGSEDRGGVITIPDLVALAGEKKAEELVLQAIRIPRSRVYVPSGGETLALVKRLVREHVEELSAPRWDLVSTPDDVALYEALARRFPEPGAGGEELAAEFEGNAPDAPQYVVRNAFREQGAEERRAAKTFYIFGLLLRSRVKEATKSAAGMDAGDFEAGDFDDVWKSLDPVRHSAELSAFCTEMLSARPDVPLWVRCGVLAARTGAAIDMQGMVNHAATRQDLPPDVRLKVREQQADVLLAQDNVDGAIAILREMGTGSGPKPDAALDAAAAGTRAKVAARLCRLGRLLERPALVKEAIAMARGASGSTWRIAPYPGEAGSKDTDLVKTLVEAGEFGAAEEMILLSVRDTIRSSIAGELTAIPVLSQHLRRLAEVYDAAGRHADVVTLLEKAPWWGAGDLAVLMNMDEKAGQLAARALHGTGRDPEALAVAKFHLLLHPEDDRAYEVLVGIQGAAAIPWLDNVYARDRFEERPLIWKAHLLRKAGRLKEAEAVARQALKVDPTDGKQSAGDRVRGYAVLAEILTDLGKTEDAAFFERVVKSVRIAERGDEFTDARMIRRSLSLYREAASSFVDAYCVQWRLAERLLALGDIEGARRHYEIAFERMPNQFGEVASFCFGCEGVFRNRQSRGVAENVLSRIVETSPGKPQVHFLLGQLREAQGREAEAYRHYRTASDLDPSYLDAWAKAYDLRRGLFLTRAEQDDMTLQMIRLDPLCRHSRWEVSDVADLKGLWAAFEDIRRPEGPGNAGLLPLAASRDRLVKTAKELGVPLGDLAFDRYFGERRRETPEPGEAVTSNGFAQGVIQTMSAPAEQE